VEFLGSSLDSLSQKPTITKAVEEQPNARTLVKVPFLRHLLRDCMPNVTSARVRQPRSIRRIHHLHTLLKSSLDLAVLRPENQNPTQVTPSIKDLATGWFRERLDIIGNRPRTPDESLVRRQKRETADWLRLLVQRAWRSHRNLSFDNGQRLKNRADWSRSVVIDGETYNVCEQLSSFRAFS
jgi:DNA (cytosine-5)-methyltransferase 1